MPAAFPGLRSRTALGTYNFTGDVGKVALPALFALIAAALGWRQAMMVTAAIAIVGRGRDPRHAAAGRDAREDRGNGRQGRRRTGPAVGVLAAVLHPRRRQRACARGFLIFLPFLLRAKGADLPTIGLALSLLFAGGAAGKLVMGWIGSRLGVVPSVVLTEVATTALILALLPLVADARHWLCCRWSA